MEQEEMMQEIAAIRCEMDALKRQVEHLEGMTTEGLKNFGVDGISVMKSRCEDLIERLQEQSHMYTTSFINK